MKNIIIFFIMISIYFLGFTLPNNHYENLGNTNGCLEISPSNNGISEDFFISGVLELDIHYYYGWYYDPDNCQGQEGVAIKVRVTRIYDGHISYEREFTPNDITSAGLVRDIVTINGPACMYRVSYTRRFFPGDLCIYQYQYYINTTMPSHIHYWEE